MRKPRAPSAVQTDAARPYSVAFARAIASASSVNTSNVATGPNSSFCTSGDFTEVTSYSAGRKYAPAASSGSSGTPPSTSTPASVAWVARVRSEEHTSELQSRENLVCRLLLEKKNNTIITDQS